MPKKEMPSELKAEMQAWRDNGCWSSVPKGYIEFHQNLAQLVLIKLEAIGVKIVNQRMVSDGWRNGMKVIHADLEYCGERKKIYWHDSNQEFFEEFDRGSAPLTLEVVVSKVI